MTADNKDIVTNNIVRIRQLFFSHVTFLSSSEISVAFSIRPSHASTNLPKRRFLQ